MVNTLLKNEQILSRLFGPAGVEKQPVTRDTRTGTVSHGDIEAILPQRVEVSFRPPIRAVVDVSLSWAQSFNFSMI